MDNGSPLFFSFPVLLRIQGDQGVLPDQQSYRARTFFFLCTPNERDGRLLSFFFLSPTIRSRSRSSLRETGKVFFSKPCQQRRMEGFLSPSSLDSRLRINPGLFFFGDKRAGLPDFPPPFPRPYIADMVSGGARSSSFSFPLPFHRELARAFPRKATKANSLSFCHLYRKKRNCPFSPFPPRRSSPSAFTPYARRKSSSSWVGAG